MSRKATALAIILTASLAVSAPPAEAARRCFGKRATIVGTNRDPIRGVELLGTPGNDVIVGLGGVDYIKARGGDDLICAGGGDDVIDAGAGNDKVKGQGGLEEIWGGGGHDRIWSGGGPAEGLFGERGNDKLFGGPGTEDYLYGGPGNDVLDGGPGHDFAMFPDSPRGLRADLRTGRVTGHGLDRVRSIEAIYGSPFDDVLYGDEKANTLAGGPGDDELYALGGDDRLRSGWGGTDLLDGGAGPDAANYYLSWDPVVADLGAGEATTSGVDTLVGISNLVGSKYDDTLTGNDEDNIIHGSRGNDAIDGSGGTDLAPFVEAYEMVVNLVEGTAVEQRWSDTLANVENVIGSSFADIIVGDEGPNELWGGGGADDLVGAGGDDILIGERGKDTSDGGEATDICDAETEIDCEIDPAAGSFRTNRRDYAAWFRGPGAIDIWRNAASVASSPTKSSAPI